MKRLLILVAAVTVLAAAAASAAGAYGGGAGHDTWQVGLSFNCDNPSFCGNDLGGFWVGSSSTVPLTGRSRATRRPPAALTASAAAGLEARVRGMRTSMPRAPTSALRSREIRTTPAGKCSTWTATS